MSIGGHHSAAALTTTWLTPPSILDAVERAAKSVDYEGQEFRLSYGNGEARCVEIYSGDY